MLVLLGTESREDLVSAFVLVDSYTMLIADFGREEVVLV